MGGENNLVLAREAVEDFTRNLLLGRVKENFRLLLHNDAGDGVLQAGICFQQRNHIYAAHPLAQPADRARNLLQGMVDLRRHLKHPLHIPVHGIADFLQAAVFPEILIDLAGKGIQVQLVQLVVQKPCRLKGIEFHRAFPGNQAHAGEAALAFLGGFKQAAVGTHLLNQPILLQQEQVLL